MNVATTTFETTSMPEDCENCGAEYAATRSYTWGPRFNPTGGIEVCDDPDCARYAERLAADDGADETRCVHLIYSYALEAAA